MKAVEKITFESQVIAYYKKVKEGNKYEFSIFATARNFNLDESRIRKIVSSNNQHRLKNVLNALKTIF